MGAGADSVCGDVVEFAASVGASRRPHRRPARDIDLLCLRHQRIARKRVRVLAADQVANPTSWRGNHPADPHHLRQPRSTFRKTSAPAYNGDWSYAIVANKIVAVPDRSNACGRTFANPHRNANTQRFRLAPERGNFGSLQGDRLLCHKYEQVVILDRSPKCRPDRKGRNRSQEMQSVPLRYAPLPG